MGLLDFLKDTIGIDPGSEYLRVIREGKLLFNECSRISLDKNTGIVTGLGDSVRGSDNDVIIDPVNCVITDFHGFETLLRGAMKKVLKSNSFISKSYKMYFCIPASTTETEKRAYRDSAEHAGAFEVHMIYQNCCSAIGLNILLEKKHFLLVDFGGSKIEVTVFIESLPVSVGVIRMGTAKIYKLIKNLLKRKYKISVTDKEIDFIFKELSVDTEEIKIQYTTVNAREIQALLDNFFALVNDEVMETIELAGGYTEIERAIATGVYFTGGGSTIKFLRDQITLGKGIRINVSQNPLLDNIHGLKKAMADRDNFKNYLMV